MLYNIKIVYIFAKRSKDMEFDDITGDGRIWAVRYDGDDENILTLLFRKWNDVDWLSDFFIRNRLDLESFFILLISGLRYMTHYGMHQNLNPFFWILTPIQIMRDFSGHWKIAVSLKCALAEKKQKGRGLGDMILG